MKQHANPKPFSGVISAAVVLLLADVTPAQAFSAQPPAGYTGVDGITCASCHTGTGNGSMEIRFPGQGLTYTPGETYLLQVFLEDVGQRRFGFELTARDAGNTAVSVGTLTAGPNTAVFDAGRHIGHTPAQFADDRFTYQFNWTAPAQDMGPVTFFAAGNAANGNFTNGPGDNIYTRTLTINPASASASFWQDVPPASGWRDTNAAYPGYAGLGWIWDGFWPWVYTLAHDDPAIGEWIWVHEENGSVDGFWAYNETGAYWVWSSPVDGWYYSLDAANSGWFPYHR